MRPPPRARDLAVLGVACAALAGCGGTQDDAATTAARRLLDAAAASDGAGACAVLAAPTRDELEQSSGKPCDEAVLEEELGSGDGPASVEVFDTMAQVVVGAETVFLSRYDGRWRVVAAACTPVPDRPYDCSIGLP
ncbi:hypothetical protein AAII07_02135 [Microvirga sp. 0TCS3.31]